MTKTPFIAKLQCQKALMRKATAGSQFGVYAYLRENDSANGKAGSPYYIGKMADAKRPWGPHTTPVPPDPRRVRLLRGGLTEQKANEWEKFYIKKFGRIDMGTGVLRNLTDGGEGATGVVVSAETRAKLSAARQGFTHSAETRAKIRIANSNYSVEIRAKRRAVAESRKRSTAAKYGISYEQWDLLSSKERSEIGRRYNLGRRGSALLDNRSPRLMEAAEKYGFSYEGWVSLSDKHRETIVQRHLLGMRGDQLTHELDRNPLIANAAAKYGFLYEEWRSLLQKQRAVIAARYRRGKRGAALLESLI